LKKIDVYEHGRLKVDEEIDGVVFTQNHWKAFVKLNTLHSDAYFEVLHNGLKFKQYVGVLQVDGLIVHIHPKADKNDSDDKWKGVLLQMLKACNKVKAQTAGNAQLKKQSINLLEVYFEYYLQEVESLLHQGLVKKYRKNSSNVTALKGKLEFSQNIQKNLIHKERFFTTHQVYDQNHLLHQVLSYANDIVSQFTRGTILSDRCRRVCLAFPEVDQRIPTLQQIESIKIDRKTAPYERALELAKFIIFNYSPDINQGNQKMIALLFDMNVLWEQYVLKQLKVFVRDQPDIKVSGQESKVFYGTHRSIRPDIVIRKGGESIVVDTKWKRPYNNAASIEDLRQMYAYGRYWDSKKLTLLYPGDFYDGGFQEYKGSYDQQNHMCKIARVSVLDGDKLDDKIAEKIIELVC
jgi:5-methylcytosine-specific restriction enzyme subunit McrC